MMQLESWCLVKECKELEEELGTKFTNEILMEPESVEMKEEDSEKGESRETVVEV